MYYLNYKNEQTRVNNEFVIFICYEIATNVEQVNNSSMKIVIIVNNETATVNELY